jgi:hypothetical protein
MDSNISEASFGNIQTSNTNSLTLNICEKVGMQNTYSKEAISEKLAVKIPNSIMNLYNNVNSSPSSVSGQKSLMDAFLESEYKKKISNKIK